MGNRHFAVLGCAIAVVCGVASAQEAAPVAAPSSSAAFPDDAPDAAAPEAGETTPTPDTAPSAAPETPPSATAPLPAPTAPPVTPAPVAPATVAPAPTTAAAGPAYGMAHTVAPPREPRSGMVGDLRFGFLLSGGGSMDPKCTGQCSAFTTSGTDFDDASSFFLGGDLLFHLSPSVRLGAAALFSPSTSISADGYSKDDSMGADLSLMAAVEGVFDTSPNTALAVRGQAGLMLLLPGGDLQDSIDQLKDVCSQGGTDVCTVNDGPYPGFTLGGGPGMIFALQKVSFRVDLWFLWYTVPNLLRTQGSSGVTDVDVSYTWTGTRLLLLGGLEF